LTLNLNGLNSVLTKCNCCSLNQLLEQEFSDYDIICFQEVRVDITCLFKPCARWGLVNSKNFNSNGTNGCVTIFKTQFAPIASQNYLSGIKLNLNLHFNENNSIFDYFNEYIFDKY